MFVSLTKLCAVNIRDVHYRIHIYLEIYKNISRSRGEYFPIKLDFATSEPFPPFFTFISPLSE